MGLRRSRSVARVREAFDLFGPRSALTDLSTNTYVTDDFEPDNEVVSLDIGDHLVEVSREPKS